MKQQRVTFADGDWVTVRVYSRCNYRTEVRILDKQDQVLFTEHDLVMTIITLGNTHQTMEWLVEHIDVTVPCKTYIRETKRKSLERRIEYFLSMQELCSASEDCDCSLRKQQRMECIVDLEGQLARL